MVDMMAYRRGHILDLCTTHYLDLLETEISNHLMGPLLRLVMMLPMTQEEKGEETEEVEEEEEEEEDRDMMKHKVEQVMVKQVSSRLGSYEAIGRVIRTAVNDAGLLLPVDADDDMDMDMDMDTDVNQEDHADGNPDIIDESQIPVVAQVAMEAVVGYMSEILTPALIVHEISGAIQSALEHIKRRKSLTSDHTDQVVNRHHGVSPPRNNWSRWTNGDGMEKDSDNEDEAETNFKGQDEDPWDQDPETSDWDTSGHLFEDFEDVAEGQDTNSDVRPPGSTNEVDRDVESSRDDEDDSDENPFAIGIQEGHNLVLDDIDEDDALESDEDITRGYLYGLQKRGVSTGTNTGSLSKQASALFKRQSGFVPDLRLEALVAQWIEPLLISFVDEDFPAHCRRAQGELMDNIIWLLDQGELNHNDDDQLALLSELEY
ncbi:hypothetical protein BGX31_004110 [Mortierella sp. GBA43]|nr:hypothetical protein BGX31_004110 [Mortierella sp. GBA43]